jgi:hypothetical protein
LSGYKYSCPGPVPLAGFEVATYGRFSGGRRGRVVDGVDAYLDEPTSGIALVFNSEKITNRKFFELMMYGDLAHVNVEKRAEYEKFIKPGLPFYETLFEQMVARLLNVIWSFPETNKRAIQALEALPDSQTV